LFSVCALTSLYGKIRTARRDQISVDERARSRSINIKLSRVLDEDSYSLGAIERWLSCFRERDLSCSDHSRSSRPVIDISECFRAFLDKFPFANTNTMSKHFRIARGTIMEILQRDLGLAEFSRR
jgi:hypothetical protein